MTAGLKSANENIDWRIGEWQVAKLPLGIYGNGFHASEKVIDAIGYVPPGIIARVEVDGVHEEQEDKQCWERMRIVEAKIWEKADSVALAIFAAELVLENFERGFPADKRPRMAIEAAKEWLRNPAIAAESAAIAAIAASAAAWSAAWRTAESAASRAAESAASAAESAKSAAWSAWSAESAAKSAKSAKSAKRARSAASAAESAAIAAESAAWSAAESAAAIKEKCSDFVIARIASKQPIPC